MTCSVMKNVEIIRKSFYAFDDEHYILNFKEQVQLE